MSEKNQQLLIKGKNVFLKYVSLEDFDGIIEIFRESHKFYKRLFTPPCNRESFNDYIKRNLEETDERFIICRNRDEEIGRTINLSQIFRKAFQNAYLGYSLGVRYTGKGYMCEAVQLILKHSFKNLKLHRIEANVQTGNSASIKALQRCGFMKEGFSPKYLKIAGKWRDHERWALTRENWQ